MYCICMRIHHQDTFIHVIQFEFFLLLFYFLYLFICDPPISFILQQKRNTEYNTTTKSNNEHMYIRIYVITTHYMALGFEMLNIKWLNLTSRLKQHFMNAITKITVSISTIELPHWINVWGFCVFSCVCTFLWIR